MKKKFRYEPAELLTLQELDEVMKALNLSDVDVIEILLNNPTLKQQNLIQEWYNNFQQDCATAEAESAYEEKHY